MYYRFARLRFHCTGCGACCTGTSDHVVETTAAEREAIRRLLGVSRAWFRRRYLIKLDHENLGIRLEKNGRCPFLGNDNRCRVYAARPLQCRTYPWWPELVAHRASWQKEAQRCAGMNCGPVVPRAHIERELKRGEKETV